MTDNDTKKIKTIRGTVTSDAMDKTVVVEVTRVKTHPLYSKKYSLSRRFKAHDENNEYKKGDQVEMTSCKPISKDKKFTVVSKIK